MTKIPKAKSQKYGMNETFEITIICFLLWLRVDWDTEEESKGHMSCCTLQELTKKVPFVPEIIGDYADDTDLLDGGGSGGPGNTKISD